MKATLCKTGSKPPNFQHFSIQDESDDVSQPKASEMASLEGTAHIITVIIIGSSRKKFKGSIKPSRFGESEMCRIIFINIIISRKDFKGRFEESEMCKTGLFRVSWCRKRNVCENAFEASLHPTHRHRGSRERRALEIHSRSRKGM